MKLIVRRRDGAGAKSLLVRTTSSLRPPQTLFFTAAPPYCRRPAVSAFYLSTNRSKIKPLPQPRPYHAKPLLLQCTAATRRQTPATLKHWSAFRTHARARTHTPVGMADIVVEDAASVLFGVLPCMLVAQLPRCLDVSYVPTQIRSQRRHQEGRKGGTNAGNHAFRQVGRWVGRQTR